MAAGKKKRDRNPRATTIWILCMAFFLGELFFYTWCRVQCTRVGYDLSRAAADYNQYLAIQNNLKIELARLKSPERIAKIARDKLGLTMPRPEQTVVIP